MKKPEATKPRAAKESILKVINFFILLKIVYFMGKQFFCTSKNSKKKLF